ncbi:MAG: hypothetical protein MJZ73_11350 [Bacteroidaceae bacterium]|nr:hypothetical protein [Bacteroidaceae bacterium]
MKHDVVDDKDTVREYSIKAIESMQNSAQEAGVFEMTFDEINEEIRLAREERKKRLGL